MPSVLVQRVCFTLSSPMSIWDNRDGGNVTLEPGNYSAHPQIRQNLTLYYIRKADENFVPQGYEVLHAWLRVNDDSSVEFGQ